MRVLVTGGSGFIGTNYVEYLRGLGQAEFVNLDHQPPRNPAHRPFWRGCDLLNAPRLTQEIKAFGPTHVVHLAAKVGLDEPTLEAYAANMEGVGNLLDALEQVRTLQRAVFTSSLLVCRVGYLPQHDTDYQPSTLYGLSKARMEQIIRGRGRWPYAWTIVRPISIWGPWGRGSYEQLIKVIARGWYFHVGHGGYRKMLGYVENAAYQLHRLLLAPADVVDRKTLYLADATVPLSEFVDTVGRAVGTTTIRHLPTGLARVAAAVGDMMRAVGWRNVPLTRFRLTNLLAEHYYDIHPILRISSPLPYDLATSMARTVQWMREHGEI